MSRATGSQVTLTFALAALVASAAAPRASALGQESYVSSEGGAGRFSLSGDGASAPLYASAEDYPGVLRALGDLQADLERVTRARPELVTDRAPSGREVVIA